MLTAALVVTGLGLALLVITLATGQLVWAWLCMVACIIGFGLLLVDIFNGRKRRADVLDSAAPQDDDPAITEESSGRTASPLASDGRPDAH